MTTGSIFVQIHTHVYSTQRNKEQAVIENNVVRFKNLNYLGSWAMQLDADKCRL